jgi:hypothetical protein
MAAADERRGLRKLKDYLDDQKPSTGAAAQDDLQTALSEIKDTAATAADAYQAIGGQPSDLKDFDTTRSYWKTILSPNGGQSP